MAHGTCSGGELGSSFLDRSKLCQKNRVNISFLLFTIIGLIVIIVIFVQVNALLETLELTDSAWSKGYLDYTTFWCLATSSKMVCSVFSATCSLQNHFKAATTWTTLWGA